MTRFLKALHYLFNPGGQTNKSKAMRRTREETNAALRRCVARQKTVDRIAYMAVSEALK